MQEEIVLTTDYPSRIAQKLLDDEIDIGLVPVAIIPRMKEAHIATDFCIGSNGPVASVCLLVMFRLKTLKISCSTIKAVHPFNWLKFY